MLRKVALYLITLLCLSAWTVPSAASAASAKVYVILWFDTEDYILPASDDAALHVAEFLTQEGIRDYDEDIKLHDRLRNHVPLHASPFEHVCVATGDNARYGKYTGWKAYRYMLPREYVKDFSPNHPELVNAVIA